jgi:hypothetical protein
MFARKEKEGLETPNDTPVNQTDHRVNVAIVGDSMVKHLNSSKLHKGSKRNVQVQTFRGANVADMNTSANINVNFHAVPRNKGVAEIEGRDIGRYNKTDDQNLGD